MIGHTILPCSCFIHLPDRWVGTHWSHLVQSKLNAYRQTGGLCTPAYWGYRDSYLCSVLLLLSLTINGTKYPVALIHQFVTVKRNSATRHIEVQNNDQILFIELDLIDRACVFLPPACSNHFAVGDLRDHDMFVRLRMYKPFWALLSLACVITYHNPMSCCNLYMIVVFVMIMLCEFFVNHNIFQISYGGCNPVMIQYDISLS